MVHSECAKLLHSGAGRVDHHVARLPHQSESHHALAIWKHKEPVRGIASPAALCFYWEGYSCFDHEGGYWYQIEVTHREGACAKDHGAYGAPFPHYRPARWVAACGLLLLFADIPAHLCVKFWLRLLHRPHVVRLLHLQHDLVLWLPQAARRERSSSDSLLYLYAVLICCWIPCYDKSETLPGI